MRGWCCGAVVGALFEQPEDADHGFTVFEWYRADLDGDACAGGGEQDAGRLGCGGGAEHLLGEQLAGAAAVFGCDDGGEVAPADVADEPFRGGVEPADDSPVLSRT